LLLTHCGLRTARQRAARAHPGSAPFQFLQRSVPRKAVLPGKHPHTRHIRAKLAALPVCRRAISFHLQAPLFSQACRAWPVPFHFRRTGQGLACLLRRGPVFYLQIKKQCNALFLLYRLPVRRATVQNDCFFCQCFAILAIFARVDALA
jgi:hypothetical protein